MSDLRSRFAGLILGMVVVGLMEVVLDWATPVETDLRAMPSARAASPTDLSRYAASCKHCIAIAEGAR